MSEAHPIHALRQAADYLRGEERHWWADTIMAAIETLCRSDDPALAQAWGEGFYAGVAADMGDWEHPPEIIPNPYLPEPNDEHTPLPENDPKDDDE